MKKPLFSQVERYEMPLLELEIAKTRLRREFEKSWCGRICRIIVAWLVIMLDKLDKLLKEKM